MQSGYNENSYERAEHQIPQRYKVEKRPLNTGKQIFVRIFKCIHETFSCTKLILGVLFLHRKNMEAVLFT